MPTTITWRPIGVGDVASLNSFPNTGEADWEDVDEETTDEDLTYLFHNNYPGVPYSRFQFSGSGRMVSIAYIRLYARMRVTVSYGIWYPSVKIGASTYWYSDGAGGWESVTGTSYGNFFYSSTTNPATGLSWTMEDIENAYFGIGMKTSAGAGVQQIRCTQVWLEITGTAYKTYPGGSGGAEETGRVGSLVHRRDVDRGIYTLEITFGGLTATPPSTGRASMVVGSGEQPYDPVPEVIPTCPPGWTLRYNAAGGWYCEPPAITGQPYSKLTNLTPYAQQRAQSLYEQGMIDESGQITEYGRWWISQHPTESPP